VAAAKPGPVCAGHSMVVDPAGLTLAALGGDESGVAVADLRAERVAEVRASMPVLAHRRFGLAPGR
jgi:deaminated glutathione amidase